MYYRFQNRPKTLLDATFQQLHGPAVAFIDRSNSFPWLRNSYQAVKFPAFILNDLRTAIRMQYERTDEVARNGVLQRITSARGFLGHPLL